MKTNTEYSVGNMMVENIHSMKKTRSGCKENQNPRRLS